MCFSLNPVCFDCDSHQPRDRWIVDQVANEYLGDTRDPIQIRDIYREMMGDLMFNIPALQLAKYHSGDYLYWSIAAVWGEGFHNI